ncbi:MAG: hypothetical protein HY689_10380 [Chloroflexi bacterium]|nr:hypothetical protein [Chloroflexota bacterium]
MNIFFDVDYTIIGYAGDLRPFVREVFEQIKADGHTIYLWSGTGIRTEVVEQHKLHHLVSGCYLKPRWDYHNALPRLGVPMVPDFVVDDHYGIVQAFGGVCVQRYDGAPYDRDDQEMKRVYQIFCEHTRTMDTPGRNE